jgi:hypothetical protein
MAVMEKELKKDKMTASSSPHLEKLIEAAIRKVGGSRENDLCRFIPMTSGGYMHHFTLRKMKHQDPDALQSMIQTFILDQNNPSSVPPKQRAARGSRKKMRDHIVLSRSEADMIIGLARQSSNTDAKELLRKLTAKKDLRAIKRELMASIRQNRVDQDLWNNYVESLNHNNA